jgi:hypothetical protein
MIKLINLLKENNISDKIMSWIDTGDFSSNSEVSDDLVNYLNKEGYKRKGLIYRVLFFTEDELPSLDPAILKEFIIKNDNNKFKSFCKDYSGVKYILDHYAEYEDHTIIIKQNSEYYDFLQFIEDNYDELEFDDEIVGEVESTQEVIAKISPTLEIMKIL